MVKNPTALKRAGTLALLLCAGTAFGDSRLEARRHFRNGMSLIAQGKYDPGIAELLEAYAIKPHANVLYNIARAYQDAGRVPEAVEYYRRYIEARPGRRPRAHHAREARADAPGPRGRRAGRRDGRSRGSLPEARASAHAHRPRPRGGPVARRAGGAPGEGHRPRRGPAGCLRGRPFRAALLADALRG
ncbi:tetratricopeptide repeat protein [Cystobacter fuscus]